MSYICPNCDKKWYHGQASIQCTSCEGWVHHNNRLNCSGLTDTEFDCYMNTSSEPFSCDKCLAESNAKAFVWLPFVDFDDVKQEPKKSDIKSMKPGELKDFIAQCDSIQNNVDDFDEMSTQVNSKYFEINELNSLKFDLPSSFGLFHVNIASLNAHIDDLKSVMARLNFNFDIIGISEHKILKDTSPSNNINISGYKEFTYEPTETDSGGTGFYIKDNLDFNQRKDLQINSPKDYESMFIEIIFPTKKNLIIGCIYRHPSSQISVEDFTNLHLDPILHKINLEKKHCILMGDFNIDLLKSETDNKSVVFYNNLSSHFFYTVCSTTY